VPPPAGTAGRDSAGGDISAARPGGRWKPRGSGREPVGEGCQVQPGSPVKCRGGNKPGRQEPGCRVKRVCAGPGSGCWVRPRSGAGRRGPRVGAAGWGSRVGSSPCAGTGSVASLPARLQWLRLSLGAAPGLEAGYRGRGPRPGRRGGSAGGATEHQPRRNRAGAAARAGHVLRANVCEGLGLGERGLRDGQEFRSEIQLPVIWGQSGGSCE